MKVKTIDGTEVEISMDEAKKVYAAMAGHTPGAAHYAALTEEIMKAAQEELREATGDFPEDLKELYEFAAKHELFGNREDTHIFCNFFKVFYCLMQKKTHTV